MLILPNDPATRPTRAFDCTRDAMAGFAADGSASRVSLVFAIDAQLIMRIGVRQILQSALLEFRLHKINRQGLAVATTTAFSKPISLLTRKIRVWFISENHPMFFLVFGMFLPSAAPAETFSANPSQRNKRCEIRDGNAGIHSTCREVLPTATPLGARSAFSCAAKVRDAMYRRATRLKIFSTPV